MKYELWDAIAMSKEEPLEPFSKLFESDNFTEMYIRFKKEYENGRMCVVVANKKPNEHKTDEKIYESPDNGETIFERTVGNYIDRKQIK